MRILHTADWHLGHTLYGYPRDWEHDRFLSWLLRILAECKVDALIIAGDIFHSATPAPSAQARWFRFLASLRTTMPPHFTTIVIGGNHDSPTLLGAPESLLKSMNIHVVGTIPSGEDRLPEGETLTIPMYDASGTVGAWCAAMPYIRVPDLPTDGIHTDEDRVVAGVRRLYDHLLQYGRDARKPGQALLATGHCYMNGSQVSEDSERKILGGNRHALPLDLFPDWVDYVALGHMHLAQRVGGNESIRYSGSPLPLSFAEDRYRHQVCLVHMEAGSLASVQKIPVPRTVEMIRSPVLSPADLFDFLAGMETRLPETMEQVRPLLEINVRLDKPETGLRRKIEESLINKLPRLLKINAVYPHSGRPLAEQKPTRTLQDMDAREVFKSCYGRSFAGEPDGALMALFDEVYSQAKQEQS